MADRPIGEHARATVGTAQRVCWYLAALAPFVTAAVRALANGWFPIGDQAQLYIRATDVFTGHHPWIGSGSSASVALGFQVNNPGPTYFDLIAPFARTLPSGPGNVIGVITVNAACLVLAGIAARRIGGAVYEAWVLAAGAVLGWTLGSELLFDIFQAHALLFPFLATLVLLSGLTLGHTWTWPWLALLLTTIAQTHISYAYALAVVLATAAGMSWRAAVRAGVRSAHLKPPRRTLVWTAGVLVVTWAQPVYEQLFGAGQGNLSRLAQAARTDTPTLGFVNAVKLIAAYVALPPWAGRQGFADTYQTSQLVGDRVELTGMPPWWLAAFALALLIGLLTATWWWARRHELTVIATLALSSAITLSGSVVALGRLTVTPLGLAAHHTRWIWPIAILAYATLGWAACTLAARWWQARTGRPPAFGPWRASLPAAVVLAAASVANVPEFAHAEGPTATRSAMPALARTFDALDRAIAAGQLPEPVYYDVTGERLYAPYSSAVQAHLRDRDVDFRIEPEFLVRQLGESRRADGSEPSTIRHTEAWSAFEPPAGCLIARTSGLTPEQDDAYERRGIELADALAGALATGTLTLHLPADAAEYDRTLATALAAGDVTDLPEITFDGRLRYWVDHQWATLTGPLADQLAAEGPGLTAWLDRLFALVVTEGCSTSPAARPQA